MFVPHQVAMLGARIIIMLWLLGSREKIQVNISDSLIRRSRSPITAGEVMFVLAYSVHVLPVHVSRGRQCSKTKAPAVGDTSLGMLETREIRSGILWGISLRKVIAHTGPT